jgi:hypothetical protein
MIEKVARAIYEQDQPHVDQPWNQAVTKPLYRDMARAAIEATAQWYASEQENHALAYAIRQDAGLHDDAALSETGE